ncbi:electron transfer flavoprotein subunit beta/FixA family protein [Halobacteriales archaeon Cl-PHB]
MKVLIAVTEVASLTDDFDVSGTSVEDRYLNYDLNEWDDYAIEAGVQLQEADVADEVVTVTVGPERADETIRMALAKGADRALRVWDDALAEAGMLDARTKAHLLAAVAAEESPDLVLTGVQADDDQFAATGVSLAEELGFEWAAVVNDLTLEDPEADAVSVHRELEGGMEELTDVDLPAVLTIQTGINEPRYASLRGIRQAQSKPLDVKSMADLGVDAAELDSPLSRTAMYEPESEGDAELWEGDAESQAEQLATLLRESGVVEG